MEKFRVVVTAEEEGQRLDRWLTSRWPDHSRAFWQRQILDGQVLVNGRREKAGYLIKAGQEITVQCQARPQAQGVPDEDATRPWPKWVVFHDDAIIVVNKPRGLVVHPAAGHWDDSLVHQLRPWLSPSDAEDMRPGIVHRLDRDTSGLLVVARQETAKMRLSRAIQDRLVTRRYVAVVRGHLDPLRGTIDAPVGRDPRQRIKMAVVQNGRPARTHYETLAIWPGASLIGCTLETGRTHQIRVHLNAMGHPVLGDALYGGRHPAFTHGQMLHAGFLSFVHPETGSRCRFVAAAPEDWQSLKTLGTATIIAPWVYGEEAQVRTDQWLSFLGVAFSA
ncbi:MAG: RluA family pseudouridine synthase [Firmicutes bacterium]|nr:RluA family pseudouridine synthase [Bacillota bacterium]